MHSLVDLDDFKARWPEYAGTDEAANIKLLDASNIIRENVPGVDGRIATDELFRSSVERVICSMVRRALNPAVIGFEGMKQVQDTTGPFSQGFTLSNPDGDLYLTKAEKRSLGIGGQRAFSVDLLGGE